MRYYSIGRINEISVIGHYPQTERTKKLGYHVDAFNSESKIESNEFPDFIPKYGLDLHPRSIETDVLDSGTLDFGLVVSQRLKTILESFKLPPNKFYPIDVYNSQNKYYWFHFISDMDKYSNFTKTEVDIYINRPPFEVKEVKTFTSNSEILSFKKKLPYNLGMRYRKITLNNMFPNYDLFEVIGAQYFTLITESLKNELEVQNITGLEYLEFNKVEVSF